MLIKALSIPDVLLIEPDVHGDHRGFFLESYNHRRYAEQGLGVTFVQDNHSRSSRGVLRGLHYQLEKPQGKLVRVVHGEVFDVAVDIRKGSPTFGRWCGEYLSEENFRMLYVPPGCAHGFCVLSETADFLYKCTDYYNPGDEQGIAWDDPAVGIEWPQCGPFQLSEKDKNYPPLAEMQSLLPVYGA